MLTGSQIRRKFLDYFVQHGHKEVHSSSLVPANDPTLLFTNAGMNQFKDVFLGLEKREYSRATSSQKCVRAGGKHNDLENVGFTNRHHTFFEMLGNFSFGDYFKKDAIAFAWELITSEKWFGIPKDKLFVTIFKGEGGVPRDLEAYDLWVAQGVSKDRIFEFGAKDNFWQMGDTGPCGPCSEIHYDMGPVASDRGHADCTFGCECGRYVEIWNLVFMQFDRVSIKKQVGASPGFEDHELADQEFTETEFRLIPLPKPSIDTGAGLERLAAVLQAKISNYETDLFVPLIEKAAELTGKSLKKELEREAHAPSAASLRVIADHSRAATFLVSDGVLPSNEGRGYVLRKIIRRAITHGRLLGQSKPFLHQMVTAIIQLMQDAYPELEDTRERVQKAILAEETKFARTLAAGLTFLERDLQTSDEEVGPEEPRREKVLRLLEGMAKQAQDVIGTQGDAPMLPQSGNPLDNWQKEMKTLSEVISGTISGAHSAPLGLLQSVAGELRAVAYTLERAFSVSDHSNSDQISLLDNLRADLAEAVRAAGLGWYPGEKAFKLYDTYGMPLDFIQDAAIDRRVVLDQIGFYKALNTQRARARASWKGAAKQTANPAYQQLPKSDFEGYRQTRSENCEVLAIISKGQGTQELKPGEEGEVILDHTPFYAESGGQVGDRGWFYSDDHNTVVAEVKGCYSPIQGVRAHQVMAKQTIRVGDNVDAVVNTDIRQSTMRNHTATHLLHAGLREILGKHVKQAGSLVAPNHLRFDFSHFTGVQDEELQDIEDLINKEVLRNEKVEVIENVPIDVAIIEYKAMALFGEKYGDKVRVIKIGDFSTELCGGTHTDATGEIGLIKVLKEGSVSSGVRRIEAVTGEGSLHHFQEDHRLEGVVASLASRAEAVSPAEALKLEIDKRDAEIKRLQRELDQARMKSASSTVTSANENVKDVRGVKVLAHRVDNLERAQMRTLVDQLRDKLGSGVVVLGSASDGRVALIVGVTKDLTSRVQAGKVIGPVAQKVGGSGGGRPDMAEAGGKNPEALDAALAGVYDVVDSLLK